MAWQAQHARRQFLFRSSHNITERGVTPKLHITYNSNLFVYIEELCVSSLQPRLLVSGSMLSCFASAQVRAAQPARSVRAQLILAQAQSNVPRSNISAPQQRGARQRMGWSVADGRVAPVSHAKQDKKPVKQTITVAVDGSEDSVQGLQWVLDNFADTGTPHLQHHGIRLRREA